MGMADGAKGHVRLWGALMTKVPYTEEFFRFHDEGARRSAAGVVPLVLEYVPAKSVVDVGCGTGLWLAAFKAAGVSDYLGIDGDYVERPLLVIEPERFLGRDLSQPLEIGRRFDLALCLEVAEHLPPASADTLVASLVRLAPVVLFSAAIPFQMGDGHINEQWPEYWRDRFAARGYVALDVLRDRVWLNKDVETWYRQNLLLYVERRRLAEYPALHDHFERAGESRPLARVHPDHYIGLFDSFTRRLVHTLGEWLKATLPLREINLVVFPNWNRPEETVVDELRTLLAAALAHPEHGRLCVVIALASDDSTRGPRLIDTVYRQVLAPRSTQPGTPPVCCVGGPRFSKLDWEAVVSVLQGHLILPAEDAEAAALRVKALPTIRLDELLNKQPFKLQPFRNT